MWLFLYTGGHCRSWQMLHKGMNNAFMGTMFSGGPINTEDPSSRHVRFTLNGYVSLTAISRGGVSTFVNVTSLDPLKETSGHLEPGSL